MLLRSTKKKLCVCMDSSRLCLHTYFKHNNGVIAVVWFLHRYQSVCSRDNLEVLLSGSQNGTQLECNSATLFFYHVSPLWPSQSHLMAHNFVMQKVPIQVFLFVFENAELRFLGY